MTCRDFAQSFPIIQMIIVYCSVLLFPGLFLYFALPWWIKVRRVRSQATHMCDSGRVCLTFDDGPDPESTPIILDLLKSAKARATFFLIGGRAERHPELVRMILDRGHEIGEHGYGHLNAWTASPWRYCLDLIRSHRTFRSFWADDRPRLFRPPHGKMNLITLFYLWLTGKHLVFWSIDPKDYRTGNAETIADHLRRACPSGGIVLLHDGRIRSGLSAHRVTIDALSMLLAECSEKPVVFHTVGVALGLDGHPTRPVDSSQTR